MRRGLAIASVLVAAGAGAVGEPGADRPKVETNPEDGPNAVLASLVTEFDGLVRGETNVLGVRLKIIPGWHVYWPGQNDSGSPVAVDLAVTTGPEGSGPAVELGEPIWPTPERYILPGNILDHVHHEELTLLVPVTVPADAELGSRVVIEGTAAWLVCADVCVPGFAEVSLETRVIADSGDLTPGPGYGSIERSRRMMPKPLPEGQRDLRIAWLGSTLVIEPRREISLIEFYPRESSATVRGLLESGSARGESAGDGLRLEAPGATKEEPVRGVVFLAGPEGSWRESYEIAEWPGSAGRVSSGQ